MYKSVIDGIEAVRLLKSSLSRFGVVGVVIVVSFSSCVFVHLVDLISNAFAIFKWLWFVRCLFCGNVEIARKHTSELD